MGSVAINLLSTLIAFSCGWLFRGLYGFWRNTTPAMKVWRLPRGTSALIVTGVHPRSSAINPAMYQGDALAAETIGSYLGRILKVKSRTVIYPDFVADRDLTKSLVVVGGPANNRLYSTLAQRLDFPYDFVRDSRDFVIVKKEDADTRFALELNDEGVTKDHAMIVTAVNPFNSKGRIVVLAGLGSDGTVAAANMLTAVGIKELAGAVPRSGGAAFVLSVDVVDGFLTPSKIVDRAEF